MEFTEIEITKFWEKVDKQEPEKCWNWKCTKDKNGYGKITFRSQPGILSHRIAFMITNGPISKGLIVRHTCDNPSCNNPSHLLSGTIKDNSMDMVSRGRASNNKGERNPRARLTETQVLEIRESYKLDSSRGRQKEFAQKYNVDRRTIHYVINRRNWNSV